MLHHLGGVSNGSPVNTHGTPVLTSLRRPWVAQPRPRARSGDTRASNTRCEQQGCTPPSHGSGAELRTTAVNDRAQACTNPNNDHSASPGSSMNTARTRVKRSADDASSCCCGEQNAADRWVKSISAWTGSGLVHTQQFSSQTKPDNNVDRS